MSSIDPRLTSLANHYARKIKALKEVQEIQLEKLYSEFRKEYQCLKETTEVQEGSSNSLTHSGADPSLTDRPSC